MVARAKDINVFKLLSDNVTRRIFQLIASERQVSYRNLLRALNEGNITIDDASESLGKLREADLIEEKSAPISEFATFYVTANGLSLERELRKLGDS